jgi:hypothetical protein
MTASVPSKTAFATSVISARVGSGLVSIDASICKGGWGDKRQVDSQPTGELQERQPGHCQQERLHLPPQAGMGVAHWDKSLGFMV